MRKNLPAEYANNTKKEGKLFSMVLILASFACFAGKVFSQLPTPNNYGR